MVFEQMDIMACHARSPRRVTYLRKMIAIVAVAFEYSASRDLGAKREAK